MKKRIRFIAMLFASFAIYFFLPSCNSSAKFTGKTGQKLTGPILIKRHNTTDKTLTLKDHHRNARYVIVSRGMNVDWNVTDPDIEIEEIGQDLKYHANFPHFFSKEPDRVESNSKRWRAIIGSPPSDSGILIEKYYIKWKLISTGQQYTFDPLLQLNP